MYLCRMEFCALVSGFLELSPKPSIDHFFASLAEYAGDHVVGIVLSGTGSDGSHGVRAIRAAGGLTVAQDPSSAKYDTMPRARNRDQLR